LKKKAALKVGARRKLIGEGELRGPSETKIEGGFGGNKYLKKREVGISAPNKQVGGGRKNQKIAWRDLSGGKSISASRKKQGVKVPHFHLHGRRGEKKLVQAKASAKRPTQTMAARSGVSKPEE